MLVLVYWMDVFLGRCVGCYGWWLVVLVCVVVGGLVCVIVLVG